MNVVVPALSAIAAVALAATLWLGTGSPSKSEQRTQAAVDPFYHQIPRKSRELVIQALQGSPEAASELISIYDECMGRTDQDHKLSHFCSQEVKRWTEIGLANGSPLAAQIKVNELLQSTKCYDVYRAEYWLTRYRNLGSGNMVMWRADALSIEKKKRSCSW